MTSPVQCHIDALALGLRGETYRGLPRTQAHVCWLAGDFLRRIGAEDDRPVITDVNGYEVEVSTFAAVCVYRDGERGLEYREAGDDGDWIAAADLPAEAFV